MKNFLLKKSKPKTPADLVREARDLLISCVNNNNNFASFAQKFKPKKNVAESIGKIMLQLKLTLYGTPDCEPIPKDCAELSKEFFNSNTLRLLIDALPKLHQDTRTDSTHVVMNLLKRKLGNSLIGCDYLEANLDIVDILVKGYEKNKETGALHNSAILKECIRYQCVAKYILDSKPGGIELFFAYIQIPDYEIAADATETFKLLLTRHKSTVAGFLSENFEWFFAGYNAKLLESANYVTRRQAVKLLEVILVDRSNSNVMARHLSSKENLRLVMNILREPGMGLKVDAFNVFKLFVRYEKKPTCIVNILVANRSKLIKLILEDLRMDKKGADNDLLEADKSSIVKELATLGTNVGTKVSPSVGVVF
ncbi:OLC1v1027632C1 [Oldenlandia corymbosa var. corymbosa]|uniref:OLC1v1027632C1 n=1 Tax=Oldenlandia corymbosa var. corymbosa TaxID=529605 RepID=A0AAV1C9X3_OLDCO|nr:OLC1v1027632C1 [Oldenlandia corymbosa var. corymbosa]